MNGMSGTTARPTRRAMVRWSWIEWLIAGAAAAASLFAAPSVCGDPMAAPVASPVGSTVGSVVGPASADVRAVTSIKPTIGKLLIDLETGESSARRASIEELSRSNDERSVGALVGAMRDDDADVRRAAMLGLWRVGRPAFDRTSASSSLDRKST